MGSRRNVLLLVGLVLGAVAALLAWFYLSRADERAEEKVELIKVVRATDDIESGTTGEDAVDEGLVAEQNALRDNVPPAAITKLDVLEGTVAASDIQTGQIITSESFVAPEAVSVEGGPLADRLKRDSDETGTPLQAVTITATGDRGVAGLVTIGDHVNVVVFLEDQTRFMLQNMEILAVGPMIAVPTATGQEGETAAASAGSGLITLEATAGQAAKLIQANLGGGQIYLTLVPPDFVPDPVAPAPVTNENLF